MGGRGTFAAGMVAPYYYEVDRNFSPDGKFHGVKVLKGIEGSNKHGLPESSHTSSAYLKMNPDGSFNTLRIYGKDHTLRLEIAYHVESTIGKGEGKVLHYHVYGEEFSKNKTGNFLRTTKRLYKKSRLYKKFKKFFKGVDV